MLGERSAGSRGVKRVATSVERRAIPDDVHRGRQRGERGGGEQHREAEAELDLDEAPQRAGASTSSAVAEPAHREEVERAEHEEAAEDRHLGQDHHAVRGADERSRRRRRSTR